MSSDKGYLDYILDNLSEIENISYRPMMGEFIIYYRDKYFGGVFDNRFLVKITAGSLSLLENVPHQFPYKGAKPMLLVENPENRELMRELVIKMYGELPPPRIKRKKERK